MINILHAKDFSLLVDLMRDVDCDFDPALSARVEIEEYASKLLKTANVLAFCIDGKLAGAIAIYMNDTYSQLGYCPFIAISPSFRGQGLARTLLEKGIEELKFKKFKRLVLTVRKNSPASYLYKDIGFKVIKTFTYSQSNTLGYEMELELK